MLVARLVSAMFHCDLVSSDSSGSRVGSMRSMDPLWDQPDSFLDYLSWASDGFQSSFYFHRIICAIGSLDIVSSCLFT